MDDAAALARNANNRNVWRNLRDAFPHPYTRADAEAWISSAREQSPETNVAARQSRDRAGVATGRAPERSAEIGYWLGEPFWGRGMASPSEAVAIGGIGLRLRKSAAKDGQVIDQFLYAITR